MRNTDVKVTEVYNYVKNYLEQNSFPPSVREICAEVGIKSTATAYAYLEKLQKQGLITKTPDKKRAFSLTQKTNTFESIPLGRRCYRGHADPWPWKILKIIIPCRPNSAIRKTICSCFAFRATV